jgi:hypothetical protein
VPAEDVDLRIRTRGARAAARDADRVGNSVGRIGARARRSAGGMRIFTRATTNAGRGLRLTAGAALYGGAAIGGGLLVELKRSTDAWQESRKVVADTGAVLRSTGGSAHVTAGHVGALANAIKRKAGVDDEAIQSGENVLLTFTRVRNEVGKGNQVFDRATQGAVDMSARVKTDLRSSFVMVGKALDDPIKGVTALRRAGVSFTKGQQEQIKTLEETGNHLGAQRLILAGLEKQVKGSAAAQATPLDRLKTTWGDLEEAIGHGMQPVTDRFFSSLDRKITRATPEIDALGQRLNRLMGRKDLTGDQKIKLGIEDVSRTLHPYSHELGVQLGRAFDAAAPAIGTAAANSAPRVLKAFVNAWWDMNPAGKLFTLALLGGKLGVFSSLGRLAFGRFSGGWGKGGLPCIPCGGEIPGRGGKAGKAGRAGRLARLGATAAAVGRYAGPVGAFIGASGLVGGPFGSDAGLGPAEERRRVRAQRRAGHAGLTSDQTVAYFRRHPRELTPDVASALSPGQRRQLGVRTRAPRARGATVHHTTIVKLANGRELARAYDTFHADERARNRERRDRRR